MDRGISVAIIAAVLFGASTPLAKFLLGETQPLLLAGLLYAGSGLGLLVVLGARRVGLIQGVSTWPKATDWYWLSGAILLGGIAGPVLLLLGLDRAKASSASLLLNMEGVFTALIAWFVFRENFDRRIAAGMFLIVGGGVVLSWNPGQVLVGFLFIAAACLCWAIDNNLTRKVSANDAVVVACLKGLTAGGVNLTAATFLGLQWPSAGLILHATLLGFLGYGLSLVCFVLALRHLGAARTGAYFSLAPFFGAALAIPLQSEGITVQIVGAAILMAAGVWLHLTERHEHKHIHDPMTHAHPHIHDEHHRHDHGPSEDAVEPHTHEHTHETLAHAHNHYPDIHHQHSH
jgi:drug/metabolite transporter (DMT)-like permease